MACYYFKHPDEWGEYNLAFNNCEHFATYCATGKKSSGQVQKTVAAGVIGAGIGVGILAVLGGALISSSKSGEDSDWEYLLFFCTYKHKMYIFNVFMLSFQQIHLFVVYFENIPSLCLLLLIYRNVEARFWVCTK